MREKTILSSLRPDAFSHSLGQLPPSNDVRSDGSFPRKRVAGAALSACGGRALREPVFFGLGHHSHSTSGRRFRCQARPFLVITGRNIMNRRTACMLIGMALVALPQLGFAQSSPQIGTWKLNL